jgi:hypothetical protein
MHFDLLAKCSKRMYACGAAIAVLNSKMAGLKRFYGKDDLSDIEVVIVEAETPCEGSGSQLSRGEQLVLPGHRLAVCGASAVLSAQVGAPRFIIDPLWYVWRACALRLQRGMHTAALRLQPAAICH